MACASGELEWASSSDLFLRLQRVGRLTSKLVCAPTFNEPQREGTPPRYPFCMVFQTNDLSARDTAKSRKQTRYRQDLQNAGVIVSFELMEAQSGG